MPLELFLKTITHTIKKALEDLNLDSLEERRQQLSLKLALKSKKNLVYLTYLNRRKKHTT